MIPALVLSIAALVAGQPTGVSCDIPAGSPTNGYTVAHSGEIHLRASYCGVVAGSPQAPQFGEALSVLVHESAHAAGVRQESCAQTWVFALYPTVLARFWGVSLDSPLGRQIAVEVAAHARSLPARYTPAACVAPDPSPPSLSPAPAPPPAPATPAPLRSLRGAVVGG